MKPEAHTYLGIEMNIQTWKLLQQKDRQPQDDRRMEHFAHASLYHWERSPKFKPVNAQRGHWLIARVYTVLGQSEAAMEHAKACMALTEEHGFGDFDKAYAHEALARALALAGDNDAAAAQRSLAEQAGAEIADPQDQKVFTGDLQGGPWFALA